MAKTIKTQIGLRRDTEANYELVKDTLIPVKGEVCMVDTNKGLKFKVGDGTSTFAQLDFIEPTTSGAGGTNVEANPELIGNEEKLNSITIDGTNYDIPSGAEAYVEEHQTLVINNNGTGTGGSSNNNLFQRRLDQPSKIINLIKHTQESDNKGFIVPFNDLRELKVGNIIKFEFHENEYTGANIPTYGVIIYTHEINNADTGEVTGVDVTVQTFFEFGYNDEGGKAICNSIHFSTSVSDNYGVCDIEGWNIPSLSDFGFRVSEQNEQGNTPKLYIY